MSLKVGLICSTHRWDVLAPEIESCGLALVHRDFQPGDVQGVLVDGISPADDLPGHIAALLSEIHNDPRKVLSVLASPEQAAAEMLDFNLTPSVRAFAQQIRFSHRTYEMEQEAELRRRTISSFNVSDRTENDDSSHGSRYVLFFGEPSVFYLKCRQWMADAGIELKATLSERTAFDALNGQQPLALLLQSDQGSFPHELVDHVQGRADLSGMPVIAIIRFTQDIPETIDGLTGVVRIGSNEIFMRKAVLSHIQTRHRVVPQTAKRYTIPVRDRYSSAFSDAFARAHILAQAVQARTSGNALSAAVLFPFNQKTGEMIKSSELAVFSGLLDSVVRCQDMIARLDWSRFLVSLPGSSASDAEQAMERIRGILESTTPRLRSDGVFSFSFRVFEPGTNRTPEQFWMLINESKWQKPAISQSSVA